MSRKTNTVEYFPHFANASSKMTITYLESKYSHQGYAIWFKLLECLASTEDHYLKLSTNLHLQYVTSKLGISYELLIKILQDLAEIDAIDKMLWNKEKIIWSDNFVANLSTVYANRHRNLPIKPTVSNNGDKPSEYTPTNNLQYTYGKPTVISRVEEVEEVKEVEEQVDNFPNHATLPENKDLEIIHIKTDDEGNPLPPVKKKRKNEDYGKYGNDIKKVFEFLDKVRGYRTTKRSIESAAICRMLKKNYTVDQINNTWRELKSDKYWSSHELFMMTVEGQIGAISNKKVQGGGYNELKQQLTTPQTDINPFGNVKD